jgi:hypothetical protein
MQYPGIILTHGIHIRKYPLLAIYYFRATANHSMYCSYEYPRVTFEGPELGPGFYYTSGIESFISTMETSALMGMNVARLIVDDYAEDWHANTMDNLQQTVLSEGANGLDNEEL